jgi:alpha-mannosidase
VAIANDSTYGHDVTRKQRAEGSSYVQVRESILRSPIYPDPNTDQGHHTVRTSIKVGANVLDSIAEGQRLNLPLRAFTGARAVEPLLTVASSNVMVESVKLAEDASGDLIVRLFEACGDRAVASLTANFAFRSVALVNLLEVELADQAQLTSATGNELRLELRPFKIATLRFKR